MKEYIKIIEFTYKSQRYNMYLDKNNKYFFLKIKNDKLQYATIDEMIELSQIFISNPDIKKNISKMKFASKVIVGASTVFLTSSLLINSLSKENKTSDTSTQLTTEQLQQYISTYDDLELGDNYHYDKQNNQLYIYSPEYIGEVINEEVTLDKLYERIDNNNKIAGSFKQIVKDYCDNIVDKYPNADLRILYQNLETLKIIECGHQKLYSITKEPRCDGCYNIKNNEIYVLRNNSFNKGDEGYQILFHELTHALKNSSFKLDKVDVNIKIENNNFTNEITDEAFTSILAANLCESEKNSSYQLQSNYYSVMIECIDYNLTDYINKPLSDFSNKLNEYNENDLAERILKLIELEYRCDESDIISANDSEFYPIIDYLCDMYFKKYVKDDMSYEEGLIIANELDMKINKSLSNKNKKHTIKIYENIKNYYLNKSNNKTKTK